MAKDPKEALRGKVVLWDIEATNLKANFGYVLSVAAKALGEPKVYCWDLSQYKSYKSDPTNDKLLLAEASEALSEAGAWVTWYGVGFDVKYVNTRLIGHGLKPMRPVPHIDGWRIAKDRMALNSNRLASVSSFLQIEDKTPLNGPIWIKASAGDPKALKYVVEHNIQDCIVLEQAFERIRPLMTSGPNLALLNGFLDKERPACPACASKKVQKKGFRIARTHRHQQYQCQACGNWFPGNRIKKEE